MIELFANTPKEWKEQAEYWFNLALRQNNPLESIKLLEAYLGTRETQEEKDYANFYVNLQLEKLTTGEIKYESNSNIGEEPAR